MGGDSIDTLSFEGLEDEDVTIFFRTFFRLALNAGHNRDEAWLQDHLEACLVGPALKFYVSLDGETKSKFQEIRTAMITRFGSEGGAPEALVPAAAPPPAAAAPPPSRQASQASQMSETLYHFFVDGPAPISGRIRVVPLTGPPGVSYIGKERFNSNPAYNHWDCPTAPNLALVFEYLPLRNMLTYIRVPSESNSGRESFLGLSLHKDSFGPYYALNFCERGQTFPFEETKAFKDISYSAWSRVWTMDPQSKELTPYLFNGTRWTKMVVGIGAPDCIFLRLEGSHQSPTIGPRLRKLVFEPF